MVLVVAGDAVAVDEMGKRCAPVLDGRSNHALDGAGEPGAIIGVQAARGNQWVQTRQPERFVDINVAETSDRALIEQQRFDRSGSLAGVGEKIAGRKVVAERFRSEFAC